MPELWMLRNGGWIVLLGHEKRASESIKYTERRSISIGSRSKFQRHPKCFNLRNMETLSRRTYIYFTLFFLYSDLILQPEIATATTKWCCSVAVWQNTLENLLQYIFLGYAHAINICCTWEIWCRARSYFVSLYTYTCGHCMKMICFWIIWRISFNQLHTYTKAYVHIKHVIFWQST